MSKWPWLLLFSTILFDFIFSDQRRLVMIIGKMSIVVVGRATHAVVCCAASLTTKVRLSSSSSAELPVVTNITIIINCNHNRLIFGGEMSSSMLCNSLSSSVASTLHKFGLVSVEIVEVCFDFFSSFKLQVNSYTNSIFFQLEYPTILFLLGSEECDPKMFTTEEHHQKRHPKDTGAKLVLCLYPRSRNRREVAS